MGLPRLAMGLFVIIASVLILDQTKAVLIPFVLALIVWYMIRLVQVRFKRITFRGRALPRWLRGVLAFATIAGVLSLFISLLISNINNVADLLPQYEQNLSVMRSQIEQLTGFDLGRQLDTYLRGMDVGMVLTLVLNALTSLLGNGTLVLIYVAFIMLEERHVREKLVAMHNGGGIERTRAMLDRVDASLSHYVTLKTGMSLLTGVVSYVALLIIGVDLAFFWAMLIFLLNYIPTVGSLLATVFPALVAAVQFGSLGPALWVLGSVGAIQLLVGNMLEPRLMGNSLNVSPLVVLLSLAFWGWLWGILGMFLSVPITVVMVLVMAQFPATRWAAVLLSEKGRLKEETS
ncbi:MAG: AI-2E family transporter [Flavobacteriales bacterium]|nr:AI-2E family transporter [Flavobacteriales bacterium]